MARLDVKLDPDSLDLVVPTRLVTGLDLIAQRIRVRLGLHQGDVLRDGAMGLPWVEWFGTKPVPLRLIESEVRRVIGTVPGVRSVSLVRAVLEGQAVAVSADVVADEGSMSVRAVVADSGTRNASFMTNIWGRASSVLL